MHNKKNSSKGGKRHKAKVSNKGGRGSVHGGLRSTVVQPYRALPSSMLLTSVFQEQGYLSSGTLTAARQWTPNSFYDCQPATGGNKWNDYDQWSALFTEYRVVSYRYTFELVNTEGGNYPLQFYILQTDANPGTTVSTYQELSGQRFCTSGQIAINPVRRSGSVSVDALIGERSPDYADTYKALMGADPTDKVWLSLGVTFSNSVSNNGLMYRLRIVAKIRLYAPNVATQFYLQRPSGMEIEATRLAFKSIKAEKLEKENAEIDDRYQALMKAKRTQLALMVEQKRKELLAS
jgi:hypothetical protein